VPAKTGTLLLFRIISYRTGDNIFTIKIKIGENDCFNIKIFEIQKIFYL